MFFSDLVKPQAREPQFHWWYMELGCFAANLGFITAPAFVPKIAHESGFKKMLSIFASTNAWAIFLRGLHTLCAYSLKSFSGKKIILLYSRWPNKNPDSPAFKWNSFWGAVFKHYYYEWVFPALLAGQTGWLHKSAAAIFITVSVGFHNCKEFIWLLCISWGCSWQCCVAGKCLSAATGHGTISQSWGEDPASNPCFIHQQRVCAVIGHDLPCFWVYSLWTSDLSEKLLVWK